MYVQGVYVQKQVRNARLNIRVTEEEREEIYAAARTMKVTVTELMVTATVEKIRAGTFKGTLRRIRERGEV